MSPMGRLCGFLALLGGCTFNPGALDPGDGPAPADAFEAPPDLAIAAAPDLSEPVDLAGVDLTGLDLAVRPDLSAPPDLMPAPPDLAKPFVPSHVSANAYNANASDLTDVTEIDTKALKIRVSGGSPQNPPTGVTLAKDGAVVVLSVGAFTVTQPLTVIGDTPLVIVAAKAVVVGMAMRANAVKEAPGPGGAPPSMGSGMGAAGAKGSGTDDSGGAGAGYGTQGGAGGSTGSNSGPAGGAMYGGMLSQFLGGSGGGLGGQAGSCINKAMGVGGAGGGAIQISSAVSITVSGAGTIVVSGGGAHGGCSDVASGGGGGGSGGEIVTVAGTLAANGGGGGAGGTTGLMGNGGDGNDGTVNNTAATGGPANGPGSAGGAGGAGVTAPGAGVTATFNGGGGGGAVGRIFLRARGTPTSAGNISPPALVDTTF